ncbi:16766_t:CDS:2, partial [Funneliformis geosporum]
CCETEKRFVCFSRWIWAVPGEAEKTRGQGRNRKRKTCFVGRDSSRRLVLTKPVIAKILNSILEPRRMLDAKPIKQALNDAQRKRNREVGKSQGSDKVRSHDSTEKSSSKKQKTSKLIEKLASPALTTTATGNLTAIITAEEQNSSTNQEIIRRNYSFEEELENMFDRFKSIYREPSTSYVGGKFK